MDRSCSSNEKVYVYIGPAALSPSINTNEHLIVITGDQSSWSERLIRKRAQKKNIDAQNITIIANTIGIPNSTKKWYSFNQPFLNGTLSNELIQWCNRSFELQTLEECDVPCKKLEKILDELNVKSNINLIIAQGDPLLIIKRSRKTINRINTIDLSLHPLGLVWKKSINRYLSELDYCALREEDFVWQKINLGYDHHAITTKKESEIFLNYFLQTLIKSIDLDEIGEEYPDASQLNLLKRIADEELDPIKRISLRKSLMKRIINFYKSRIHINTNKNKIKSNLQKPGLDKPSNLDKFKEQSVIESQKKQLIGHIDGFGESLQLRGWVDASDFGPGQSKVKVILNEENRILVEGTADIDRPDLLAAGIKNSQCGFSINLEKMSDLELSRILDQKLSFKLIESKSGQTIGGSEWIMSNSDKLEKICHIIGQSPEELDITKTFEYINSSPNKEAIIVIKNHVSNLFKTKFVEHSHKELESSKQALQSRELKPQINSKQEDVATTNDLRGYIDGINESLHLRGWVDASDFGSDHSRVKVIWKDMNTVIGEGIADIDRPDLKSVGIENCQCGFAIDIEQLTSFSLLEILDNPLTLDIVESKSGQIIGGESWIMSNRIKREIIGLLLQNYIKNNNSEEIENFLSQSSCSELLLCTRKYLLEYSILKCQSGKWIDLPLKYVLTSHKNNPQLNYGVDEESAYRLEWLLTSVVYLIHHVDRDKIHQINIKDALEVEDNSQFVKILSDNLKQSCYASIQGWEMTIWSQRIRPLIDTFLATLFLQEESREVDEIVCLLESISLLANTVYASPHLSSNLNSLINSKTNILYSSDDIALDHKRNDHFSVLFKNYSNGLKGQSMIKNIYHYAAAIDFASSCPAIYSRISKRFNQLALEHLKDNYRESSLRHWVDRLGTIANNITQRLVGDMITFGFERHEIVNVHREMIIVKRLCAEILFPPNLSSSKNKHHKKRSVATKWLIIGEKNLPQCWIYRVEQKKHQLEELGCEVRCIDWQDLRFWSFTHDILWCDSVIICRLPAFYTVYRTMAFARYNHKKIYTEIDDLIFTSEYPAEYASYGGSISRHQYANLSIDYVLRQSVMKYSDEIIVSTTVLAEKASEMLGSNNKPIHVLQNLPLIDLINIGDNFHKSINAKKNKPSINIILTSGTLSHKQILNESIFPVLKEILATYKNATISTIGHITLPSYFDQYSDRIQTMPFSDYTSYLEFLSKGDLALVPLESHATTDGKSAIKWMEASYCGVPCICSPVRAYTDVTTDQSDVLIAHNKDQWKQSICKLLDEPSLRIELTQRAFESAQRQFNGATGINFWKKIISPEVSMKPEKDNTKKVLLINVYFAPQSIGGATRVAQDYVQDMLDDPNINYDVTVLCTEYDHWHSNHGLQHPPKKHEEPAISANIIQSTEVFARHISGNTSDANTLREINKDLNDNESFIDYQRSLSVDTSYWNGVKVVRLNMAGKPWWWHEDKVVEAFCQDFFATEVFDEIQCHCCQIITASPIIVAKKMNIPYDIIMHDAWWMSPEQFLVTKEGRIINPKDPLGHFDIEPREDEILCFLERRHTLFSLLSSARQRIAVSESFASLCRDAGIKDVSVKENKFTSMKSEVSLSKSYEKPYKVCHIGGMSLHKGYQLLRNAVYSLPINVPMSFTIIDHRLSSINQNYSATWNGYKVQFIAPIPMNDMPDFYRSQDVLVAPSIWPESFGLVTREALSAGLWVIASDAGALAEPLKFDSSIGTIIKPNDLQDLVNALKLLPQQLENI